VKYQYVEIWLGASESILLATFKAATALAIAPRTHKIGERRVHGQHIRD
jgi:hypothetical protein